MLFHILSTSCCLQYERIPLSFVLTYSEKSLTAPLLLWRIQTGTFGEAFKADAQASESCELSV